MAGNTISFSVQLEYGAWYVDSYNIIERTRRWFWTNLEIYDLPDPEYGKIWAYATIWGAAYPIVLGTTTFILDFDVEWSPGSEQYYSMVFSAGGGLISRAESGPFTGGDPLSSPGYTHWTFSGLSRAIFPVYLDGTPTVFSEIYPVLIPEGRAIRLPQRRFDDSNHLVFSGQRENAASVWLYDIYGQPLMGAWDTGGGTIWADSYGSRIIAVATPPNLYPPDDRRHRLLPAVCTQAKFPAVRTSPRVRDLPVIETTSTLTLSKEP